MTQCHAPEAAGATTSHAPPCGIYYPSRLEGSSPIIDNGSPDLRFNRPDSDYGTRPHSEKVVEIAISSVHSDRWARAITVRVAIASTLLPANV
jgi:hypothetical protein